MFIGSREHIGAPLVGTIARKSEVADVMLNVPLWRYVIE
jgi:hypothetical protein